MSVSVPTQAVCVQMGFGGVMQRTGTETCYLFFKQKESDASCELKLFTIIHTTYHTAFSRYPHDSLWKCRHILGGRYDIE